MSRSTAVRDLRFFATCCAGESCGDEGRLAEISMSLLEGGGSSAVVLAIGWVCVVTSGRRGGWDEC